MIEGHGNDIYHYKGKIKVDFSSNVSAQKLSKEIIGHLSSCLTLIENYPEPDAQSLQKDIAAHHGVKEESILVTNGSTEAFYLLAHYFQGKESTIFTPSFAEYEDACTLYKHKLIFAENLIKFNSIKPKSGVVWLGNPNNPDGKVTSKDDILKFCKEHPDVYLVVDEAYADLCYGFDSIIPFVEETDNLIVVRSLTKTFSIPGLRAGYIVAGEAALNRIGRLKMPWSVNTLAIEAGKYLIRNYKELQPDKKLMFTNSSNLQYKMERLTNVEVINSRCNFFLVRLLKGKAKALKEFLIDNYGFLIRDASNFRGLDESYFRVAVQGAESNVKLIKGIQQWMQQQ